MGKLSTLLSIDNSSRAEAQFMSKSFIDLKVKKRVYINTLGAECLMRYLAAKGVRVNDLHNMHSITRVIEKFDIADILLNNIHLDARVVFDEDKIFIPKSHHKYGLTPDLYVVLKVSPDMDFMEMLGYFKPEIIDYNNANKDYYFVSKADLSDSETLCSYIQSANYTNEKQLDETDILRGRELSISMADHDISDDECIEFVRLLKASAKLRDSVLEYDNFETLSYDVVPLLKDYNPEFEETSSNDEFLDDMTQQQDDNQEDEQENGEQEDIIQDDVESEVSTDIEIDQQEEQPLSIDDFETVSIEPEVIDNQVLDMAESVAGAMATGEMLSSGVVTDAAMELVEQVGDGVVNVEEQIPEIITELPQQDIDIESDLDIEPLDIEGDITQAPIEVKDIVLPENETSQNDIISMDENSIGDFLEGEQEVKDIEVSNLDDFSELEISNDVENLEPATSEFPTSQIEDIIEVSEPPVEEYQEQNVENFDEEFFNSLEMDDMITEPPVVDATAQQYSAGDLEASPQEDFLDNFEQYSVDEIVEKPVNNTNSIENATVISDKMLRVGEIPIDINNMQENYPTPSEHLENIYNDSPDMVSDAPFNNSVRIGGNKNKQSGSKKGLIAGVGALVVLAGVSFAAMRYLKPAQDTNSATLPAPTQPQAPSSSMESENTLKLDESNVVSMEEDGSKMSSVPGSSSQPAKKMASTSFLTVNKLSWEVPDYISYNAAFKQYFQSAGKSLKSGLKSDLLLADEYVYSNEVKVSILYDKSGAFREAKILSSSGSSQVDKIVLQSVNRTLNILKAPQSVGNDESTTVILKIYL